MTWADNMRQMSADEGRHNPRGCFADFGSHGLCELVFNAHYHFGEKEGTQRCTSFYSCTPLCVVTETPVASNASECAKAADALLDTERFDKSTCPTMAGNRSMTWADNMRQMS